MIKIVLNYRTLDRVGETPATPEELEKWLNEDGRAVIESDILPEEYKTVAEAEAISKTLPRAQRHGQTGCGSRPGGSG